MPEIERIIHYCEPIEVFDIDPVPTAKKAVGDARRLHPNADILPDVITAVIDLSNSQHIKSLAINAAHKIATYKKSSLQG